jgi:two-component system OmpR family response regulator
MRVLVIEDDAKIASFVLQGLKEAGFAVDHAVNGDEGLDLALMAPYDAAVIDLMLPNRDGLSVIEELRTRRVNTPVIILSAKRTVDERVRGLQVLRAACPNSRTDSESDGNR